MMPAMVGLPCLLVHNIRMMHNASKLQQDKQHDSQVANSAGRQAAGRLCCFLNA